MRRIVEILTGGGSITADRLRLDFDARHRRRAVLETLAGERVLLDGPRAVHLRGGDAVRLDDGRLLGVEAAPEALVEIAADGAAALVRLAWHLGNRHLPTQLVPGPDGGTLRIRTDHVIVAMVEGLGARCTALDAPFDPEGGAYEGTGGHDYDAAPPASSHSHGRGHSHSHHAHDYGH